jgi:hypothetical protein
VVEVFSLQEEPCAARMLRKALRLVQRRRPPAVMPLQPVQLVEESLVTTRLFICGSDLLDHRHQCLGNEPPAVDTEMATRIGIVDGGFGHGRARTRQLGAGEIRHQ